MPSSLKNSFLPSSLAGVLWATLLLSPPLMAVELEQLWVPKSYLRHLPRLYDAARLVEQSPRCKELIEGTTHLGRTTAEHPVFTFKCRNEQNKTFSVMVDGPTLKKVDDARPGGLVSFEQLQKEYEQAQARKKERERKERELAELEQRRQEADQERRQWLSWWEEEHRRREALWQQCVEKLKARVGGMRALEWLTQTMPEPELAHEPRLDTHPALTFTIDFNAESYYGEALRYRVLCQREEGEVVLDIGPRREAGEAKKPSE
ncbi:hypothetical protein [Marinimicrobium locisalis]|uniref:hypothetical protein n=1 Tax=Marinimicrobium locisalis TaxID=546022 RepID=UPI0032214E99